MKKNNIIKRSLALFLVLVLCISLTSSVFASNDVENSDVEIANQDEMNIALIAVDDNAGESNDAEEVVTNEDSEEVADIEGDYETTPEEAEFDMTTDTKRPEASDTVSSTEGTPENKNWEIFYDADKDVYKVTFNIGSDAEGTQVIDLTQALELLGQYAESGKQELQAAIDALTKPEMGKTDMEKPVEPGKPENLEENLGIAYDNIIASVPRDDEGEPAESFDYAGAISAATGLSVDDAYVKSMASYMYDQAMVDWCMDNWADWEASGHPYANYFGDPDTFLYYGCGISVKWPDGYNKGTPVLNKSVPVYVVDTTTDEYKEYLDAKTEYDAAMAEIEKKFADDKAAYDAEVAKRKAEFDRRVGANVLEPGDVKKFELYLTSDSKHTYKYQSGSFTLATPGWTVNENGEVVGFDGQILPDEYVDHANYNVTVRSEPIQALYDAIGLDAFDKFNGHPGWANYDIKEFLADYEGETLAEQLNSYILAYYNGKDGTEYATIDELVKNNADARAELTKTETSGNKWFAVSGETFVVDAHLETVKYDNFYKNLFSFAFGDEADINEILGEAKFNKATNRWEYENDSWTDNGYMQALYYYMDHKEIWQQTDAYFNALLDGGLTAEQATWTSLMMALNIDGELTGNDWQSTKWPWYNSIQLEQMDIDFNLTKTDGEKPITSSNTEFQIWYIDKVKGEDGTETNVNMYCSYDEETGSYTFVTTESTVWTKDGELNIDYAMMKDIVYYLKEMTAPEGYDRDTNVYIVMSEEDYNKLTDEAKDALEGTFDKFLNTEVSEDGLTVSTEFVNVKIVTPPSNPEIPPENPPEEPENPPENPPEDPENPPENPPEEPDIPDEDPPLGDKPEDPEDPDDPPEDFDIPDDDVPLGDRPNIPSKPDTPDDEIDIPDDDIPLADSPDTGDSTMTNVWALFSCLSICGLAVLVLEEKKRKSF